MSDLPRRASDQVAAEVVKSASETAAEVVKTASETASSVAQHATTMAADVVRAAAPTVMGKLGPWANLGVVGVMCWMFYQMQSNSFIQAAAERAQNEANIGRMFDMQQAGMLRVTQSVDDLAREIRQSRTFFMKEVGIKPPEDGK